MDSSDVAHPANRSISPNDGDTTEALEVPVALAGRLATEMRGCWGRGEQTPAEEFLARYPELGQQPNAAIEIIYEEILLRQERGQKDVWPDFFSRFPEWHDHLQALQDCHQLLDSPGVAPQFPAVGESLGEYHVLAELGRGSLGRVFLATQPALANRLVVLKLTPQAGREHLSLARLQHTNIVPLYAARDDRARHLRVLCMPYFGGAPLSEVLRVLAPIPLSQRSGKLLLDAVDQIQAAHPVPDCGASASRRILSRASYVQAICWIAAGCADALQYAHERGLLHLDLKPSNVLIAADGQPMLLDFHLAHEPVLPNKPLPSRLGGTPGYMAPEQRAAAEAVARGGPVRDAVDAGADLYSLGALLYEALGGTVPFDPTSSKPLRLLTAEASVGLSDIVAGCLSPRSADRYPNAAELAADLRRQITDRPLRGIRNRSMLERWQKWRRRQPAAFSLLLMFALTTLATGALAVGTWSHIRHRIAEAELALAEGKKQWQDSRHFEEAEASLRHGLSLVDGLPFTGDLTEQLQDQIDRAARAGQAAHREWLVKELHGLIEQLRVSFGMDLQPSSHLSALVKNCRELWERRDAIQASLSPGKAGEATADLVELAVLWSDLRVRSALLPKDPTACREALRTLEEARVFFGPSAVFDLEQARYRRALGVLQAMPAQELSPTPRTIWERYALGRSYYRSGDLLRAEQELKQALVSQPQDCWLNYYYGLCAFGLHRYEDAALAFSVCIGAAPNLAGMYYNRALTFSELGKRELASRDYDRALELDPSLSAAALNRGMLRLQEKRFAEAISDLERALGLGAPPDTVHYDLALIALAQDKRSQAITYLHRALERAPNHRQARLLLENLEKPSQR